MYIDIYIYYYIYIIYIYTSTVVHLYMSSTNYTPLGNNDRPVPSLFRLRWVFGLRIMSTAKKMSTMTSFLGRIRKYFGGSSLYISLSTRIPVMEWENLDHLSLAATRSNRKGPKVPKIFAHRSL